MAMADFDIVGGYNADTYTQFDPQRTVNLYIEIDAQAKKPKALVPWLGHKLKVNPAEGSVVRRLFVNGQSLYDVSSSSVYKIDAAFSATKINSALPLNTSSGYIGIDANSNNQIIFVDGTGGYLYKNSDNSFSGVSDANFPSNPTDVAFFDGFFICNVGGTNEFRLSNPNDGAVWTFEGQPRRAFFQTVADTIVAFQTFKNRLYVFGQYSTEQWYNAGAAIVPFRPDKNAWLDYGCAAPGSVASGHQLLFWLARTKDGVGTAVMTDGSMPKAISTRPVELAFQSYDNISDAIGSVIKIPGHIFYMLSFPSVGKTWVYDVMTDSWLELEAEGGERYAANCHAYFNDTHLIGDFASRKIYEMSRDYFDYNGTAFRWLRTSKHFSDPLYRLQRVNRVQLDTVKGFADSGSISEYKPKSEPKMFLYVSRNGGMSYLDPLSATYTKIGQYRSRAVWWSQGISEDFVFKVEGYSGLPFMLLGGSISLDVLRY